MPFVHVAHQFNSFIKSETDVAGSEKKTCFRLVLVLYILNLNAKPQLSVSIHSNLPYLSFFYVLVIKNTLLAKYYL